MLSSRKKRVVSAISCTPRAGPFAAVCIGSHRKLSKMSRGIHDHSVLVFHTDASYAVDAMTVVHSSRHR